MILSVRNRRTAWVTYRRLPTRDPTGVHRRHRVTADREAIARVSHPSALGSYILAVVMRALELVDSWPVDHAAAGWIGDDDRSQRSTGSGQRFALASLTKPLFALSLLVAVEEGSLSLDLPLGPPGSTVRHLLAHASGIGPDSPEALAPAGSRRIYSNAGFELLGRALAEHTSLPAPVYFHEAVVEPLGLTATSLEGSPAHGAFSSIDDLLLVLRELLDPTLISPHTLSQATEPQFPQLGGVLPGYGRQLPNPWGLGFELRGDKHPHWTGSDNSPSTFGHFGRAGTMMWVDPMVKVGCVALTDRTFGSWAQRAWPEFSNAVLGEAA